MFCVKPDDVAANVANRLTAHVAGYVLAVGTTKAGYKTYPYEYARMPQDPYPQKWASSTKYPPASVGKVLTALPVVRLLASGAGLSTGRTLDTTIATFLPPRCNWAPGVPAITFRQLLTMTSGIRDSDPAIQALPPNTTPQSYSGVRTFLEKANVSDKSQSYTDMGYALLRILVPQLNGYAPDYATLPADHTAADNQLAEYFAEKYVATVNQYVFAPVGVTGVSTKKTSANQSEYSLRYYGSQMPITTHGDDAWGHGDMSLVAGAGGWWVSIDDIMPVLESLAKVDGRILAPVQWSEMLGRQALWMCCANCGALTYAGNPDPGACVNGGVHDHTGSGNYHVTEGGIAGPNQQPDWKWCRNCQSLVFADNNSGDCWGDRDGKKNGGKHDLTGSGNYVLTHDLPLPSNSQDIQDQRQDQWKYCRNCKVLAYTGHSQPGLCPTGTQPARHDHTGSGNYQLAEASERYASPLGFDTLVDPKSPGYAWVEKNGGDAGISASICLFGMPTGSAPIADSPVVAALFINSAVCIGANEQEGWGYCDKCSEMVSPDSASSGICPADKKLHAANSGYVLSKGQGEWRLCRNCQALCHTAGYEEGAISLGPQGAVVAYVGGYCTTGGQHQCPLADGEFTLEVAVAGADSIVFQDGWMKCKKCDVLSYPGNGPAPCAAPAAAGQKSVHDTSGSANYSIHGAVPGADTVLREALRNAVTTG